VNADACCYVTDTKRTRLTAAATNMGTHRLQKHVHCRVLNYVDLPSMKINKVSSEAGHAGKASNIDTGMKKIGGEPQAHSHHNKANDESSNGPITK